MTAENRCKALWAPGWGSVCWATLCLTCFYPKWLNDLLSVKQWKSDSNYYSPALFHVCFFTWIAWNWSQLILFTVPVTQPLGLDYSLYSLKHSWYRQWWLCFHHLKGGISDNCLIPGLWFHCLQFFHWGAAQLYHVLVESENFQLTIDWNYYKKNNINVSKEVCRKWWHCIGSLRMFTRATVAKQIKYVWKMH